jgi:diguanylate cyclase (GGDEF)-like protein
MGRATSRHYWTADPVFERLAGMADDIRYSEMRFLQSLPSGMSEVFNHQDPRQWESVGLNPTVFIELVLTMIEELYVRLDDQNAQLLVGKLRGEVSGLTPTRLLRTDWENPRAALENLFLGNNLQRLRLTYRGLRRIEELREALARDRIMEPFGVLLSMQYFRHDLEQAVKLNTDTAVSVLYADMDHFKQVNTKFGQDAGDVVMKAYFEVVRDQVGIFGKGYRGLGDEVVVLIRGQGHSKAIDFAERIRNGVKVLKCEYRGQALPRVTASIGVATAPPEERAAGLATIAEERKRNAKNQGRDAVVAE